jgi:2-phospho-L-lactate guanylyltransferase
VRAALIPVKSLRDAKTRLADALDARARAELVLAMLSDGIEACLLSGVFELVCVISDDSDVLWHARELGAKPLAEPAMRSGLNESLTFGQRYMARRVAVAELLILPADVPLVRPDDICAVADALAGGPEQHVVIVPARDGGTNALALRPPEAIPMSFGSNSAAAHRAAAERADIVVTELQVDRLAFDVDDLADVDALASLPVGGATLGWLQARAHYAAPGGGR